MVLVRIQYQSSSNSSRIARRRLKRTTEITKSSKLLHYCIDGKVILRCWKTDFVTNVGTRFYNLDSNHVTSRVVKSRYPYGALSDNFMTRKHRLFSCFYSLLYL
ncbi:hypothetical protein KIN20_025627 [Parelaphostrongylus tenuis]|uniref:Uncharacterized protein n=1 Tax=Parelaphostrongylus tenuis TaxID=148309 RepID=A0AAD5MVK0_PARTN|nr:hypothetical protein KIN20_025627 [Parelaphostrongylus tenuis]